MTKIYFSDDCFQSLEERSITKAQVNNINMWKWEHYYITRNFKKAIGILPNKLENLKEMEKVNP